MNKNGSQVFFFFFSYKFKLSHLLGNSSQPLIFDSWIHWGASQQLDPYSTKVSSVLTFNLVSPKEWPMSTSISNNQMWIKSLFSNFKKECLKN